MVPGFLVAAPDARAGRRSAPVWSALGRAASWSGEGEKGDSLDLNELSERLARLEAASANMPDAWPVAADFPDIRVWNDPEPLPWPADEGSPRDQPASQGQ